MPTHKTTIDKEIVNSFLRTYFDHPVLNFETINGGEGSQAYGFKVKEEKYIIRVNKHYNLGFKKDEYAFNNYSSQNIPVPVINKIGLINDTFHYCISQRVEGIVLSLFSTKETEVINSDLFMVLDSIHAIDVSGTKGFGKWNEEGVGECKKWKDRILMVDEYVKDTAEKPGLFKTSFLEKDFWDNAYNIILKLLPYCPEEKYLVHGDYGFDNILSNGRKITGVIDWEESMYGDFIYDVAWLDFWSKKTDYKNLYAKHYQAKKIKIINYEERILCYKIYIGLRTLSFYAYSEQKNKYDSLKKEMEKIIEKNF